MSAESRIVGCSVVFLRKDAEALSPKAMPSSHLCVNCFRVSKIALHGFCTEFARFQPVQWLTTGAKFVIGRKVCILINGVLSIKEIFSGRHHDEEFAPGLRYESVGRGFESLPSHQKPTRVSLVGFLFCPNAAGKWGSDYQLLRHEKQIAWQPEKRRGMPVP